MDVELHSLPFILKHFPTFIGNPDVHNNVQWKKLPWWISSWRMIPTNLPDYAPWPVGRIHDIDSKLDPDGDWSSTSFKHEPFKLSFHLVEPKYCVPFEADFRQHMQNLNIICGCVCHVFYDELGAITPTTPTEPQGHLFLQYDVFVEKAPGDIIENSADIDNCFTFNNWPVCSEQAKVALRYMHVEESHEIMPIPAYSINKTLLKSQEYAPTLNNPIVVALFTMCHTVDRKSNSDTFDANILKINVVARPPITLTKPHPRDKHHIYSDMYVKLEHMLVCILVKLEHMRSQGLEGLESNVILQPTSITYQIKMKDNIQDKLTTSTIQRQKYSLTGAYAFTDYRSQGQTLSYVIIDIASPPTGGLSLFNIYVALSRGRGRQNIRLLRDFKRKGVVALTQP